MFIKELCVGKIYKTSSFLILKFIYRVAMGTTQDVAVLTRKLGAGDYDPVKYVAEISQRCVGGEEVHAQRKVIHTVADETNNQLKKNVYQN